MKIRTAKDFSRKEIYEIALLYSKGTYSYHDFIDEFGSSQSTFYTLINWAVVKGIVPDKVVVQIEAVAVLNSTDQIGSISKDSRAQDVAARGQKCNRLRRLDRLNYTFPKSEAIEIIKKYIACDLSKDEFCKQNYMTEAVFGRTLKKAVVKKWIGVKMIDQLREKSYKFNDKERVDSFFASLMRARNG